MNNTLELQSGSGEKKGVEADANGHHHKTPPCLFSKGRKHLSYNYGDLISWKMIFGQNNCIHGIKPMESSDGAVPEGAGYLGSHPCLQGH